LGTHPLLTVVIVLACTLVGALWVGGRSPFERNQLHCAQKVEEAIASDRIPRAEDLSSIADAVQEFLAAFATYKLFLDKPTGPVENVIPQYAILERLCRLEKLLNPQRLPYGSPELTGFAVRGWPLRVMTAYPKLKNHATDIIKRWDVPEICQDRPLTRGKYGATQADGTFKEIDRPARPPVLTPVEVDELVWILGAFNDALGKSGDTDLRSAKTDSVGAGAGSHGAPDTHDPHRDFRH
jgi:hypothetical protein